MLIASCLWLTSALLGAEEEPAPAVSDLRLETADGAHWNLYSSDDRLGTVLLFADVTSDVGRSDAETFAALREDYEAEGFSFALIATTTNDAQSVSTAASSGDLTVTLDPTRSAARQFGVSAQSEAFILDAQWGVVYRGALDDGEEYAALALESILSDETPDPARTEAPGTLTPLEADSPWSTPRFHEEIEPILHAHCVTCHRDGQIGPMSLFDYEDVRGWAPMIAEVVGDGTMPPWHADSRFGTFRNARRLTHTDKALLDRWAETGATKGDPTAAPRRPSFPSRDWEIGTPDLVVELPEVQDVPATGVVPYRYIVVDPELTEDRWVSAVEIRPTDPSVTHHALVLLIPPGMERDEVFRDQEFVLSSGHFGVNVPGMGPAVFPPGYAIELKAGTRFLFQMHYTPNGIPATDQTRMAVQWHDGEVTHPVLTRAVLNFRLDIPPFAENVTFHAQHEFRKPTQLLALFPHLHARGKAFRFELETFAGKETILDVPKYDFNWQHTYYYAQPLELTPGTQMLLTARYDNSEANTRNPDPSQRVRWGDQTWEEMLVGYVTYVEDPATTDAPSND